MADARGSSPAPPVRARSSSVYTVMANLGGQPRCDQLWPRRRRPHQPRGDPAHPGRHAQRARGGRVPAVVLAEPRHGGPRGLRTFARARTSGRCTGAGDRGRGRDGRRTCWRRVPGCLAASARTRSSRGRVGATAPSSTTATLYIKPSGVSLASMTPAALMPLAMEPLLHLAADRKARGWQRPGHAGRDGRATRDEGARRPSVECVFHALIPRRFVIHTHPTTVNALTCTIDGEAIARELFGDDVVWIRTPTRACRWRRRSPGGVTGGRRTRARPR